MKLYITDNQDIELGLDSIIMGSTEFNSIQSHPYIKTAGFSAVIVDITNSKIRFPYVQGIMNDCMVIPYYKGGNISEFGVCILCELYKEHAAEIRYLSFCNPEKFLKLVNELKEKHEWEIAY